MSRKKHRGWQGKPGTGGGAFQPLPQKQKQKKAARLRDEAEARRQAGFNNPAYLADKAKRDAEYREIMEWRAIRAGMKGAEDTPALDDELRALFGLAGPDEALVQCWVCCHHEYRLIEDGPIRCLQCGGAVEVLTINGAAQP